MNPNNAVMPIVFAADEKFIPYTSAMIQSIMENAAPENQYRIFILHAGVPDRMLDMLSSQTAPFPHFSVTGINLKTRIKGLDFFTENRVTLTRETYFRLFIPELFAEYDKVLYLDGDMICRADISRLFAFDLGDNLIGAVRDFYGIGWIHHYGRDNDEGCFSFKMHARNLLDCYNGGLLIFNIRQFQKTISTKELLDLALSRKWCSHDQDVLNFVTEGRTFFVPYQWNFSFYLNPAYLPKTLEKEYYESIGNEKIIHFCAGPKPWEAHVFVEHSHIRYFAQFWKYALRSPFADTILDRMEENHLIGGSYESFALNQIRRRNGGFSFILKCLMARLGRLSKKEVFR
jgi:lipopolysaccharide biosynthesis glycosyltransferase